MPVDEISGVVGRLGLVALFVLLLYPFNRIIYNLYFSPLARFSGPRTWAATRIPFIRSLVRGTIVHDVEKIHRKYGPIARIAPGEISFARADAWTDIFQGRPGHLQFPKDPIWWARQPGQADSLISANDPEDHARMRKLLSHGFTEAALKAQEPIVQKYVSLLVERLRERVTASSSKTGKEGVVDIVPWLNFTTFDIFGDLGFGESFDCLQHTRYHPWIKLLFSSVKASAFVISARFYPSIGFLMRKCIPKSIMKMKENHYNQIVDKVQRRLNWEVERPDIMSHVIKHNNKKGMTLEEIQVTFMVLTTAGSETTATVLNGCLSYLVTHPDKLAVLVEEVRGNFSDEFEMSLDTIRNLPYLNAVISESLRLCPPIPTMLPRLVPRGGDTVCGMWMPGGTSVSVHSWALSRDPTCFHQSTSFLPQRWLPEAKEKSSPFAQDQLNAVQAFSVGPSKCMGKHLAWAEMRLILARLVWAFDMEAASEPPKWSELRTFLLVEKRPLELTMRVRQA